MCEQTYSSCKAEFTDEQTKEKKLKIEPNYNFPFLNCYFFFFLHGKLNG